MRRPSGSKATARTAALWPPNTDGCRRRGERPRPHRAIVGGGRHARPVGTEHDLRDAVPMSGRTASAFPVSAFHTRITWSQVHVAMWRPSRLKAAETVEPRRPLIVPCFRPKESQTTSESKRTAVRPCSADVPVGGHREDNRRRDAEAREDDRRAAFPRRQVEHRQGSSAPEATGTREGNVSGNDIDSVRPSSIRRKGSPRRSTCRTALARAAAEPGSRRGSSFPEILGSERRQRPTDDERAGPIGAHRDDRLGLAMRRAAGT